jgi:ADP-heptose:LPS heptosyltransferase
MEKIGKIQNILIIKPGAIGDLIQLTPVIQALGAGYPGARITLLTGSRETATLFRYNPHVAETMVYDKRGEHRSLSSFLKLWRKIQKGRFDLVLQFQRSNLKTWFLALAAFPCRVLVYHKARSRTVHVVDNYLETLAPLGISRKNRDLELYTGRDDEQFAEDFFSGNGFHEKLVVALNPGASHPVNRWGPDRFAELADSLAERLGAVVLIIGGKEDIPLADRVAAKAASKPLVLAGKVTLLQLGAILKRCGILVSGDTGPLHLATAVGTRVVALFGAADPARTGPVGTGHRVIQAPGVQCVPCGSRACSGRQYLECMDKIPVAMVADAVTELVGDKDAR